MKLVMLDNEGTVWEIMDGDGLKSYFEGCDCDPEDPECYCPNIGDHMRDTLLDSITGDDLVTSVKRAYDNNS